MHLDLDRYFKTKAEKFLHQASTPTRFLLSGCLRWLAGGSGHDIIFFCGVRYRTWQKQRWIVLDALLELYFKSKIQLPTTDEARKVLSEIFKEKNGIDGQLFFICCVLYFETFHFKKSVHIICTIFK